MRGFLMLAAFCLATALSAATLTVQQDGMGDFTVIQDAINATTTGDTVLVWPGTYCENLVIDELSFTLSGLFQPGMSDSLISATVIDGMGLASVIWIMQSDSVSISGFTITGGSAMDYNDNYYGGGIYAGISNLRISDCVIEYNECLASGGGIYCVYGELELERTCIRHNRAGRAVGGFLLAGHNYDTFLIMSEERRCSIYGNRAPYSCDIGTSIPDNEINIVLDTLSVLNPSTNEIALFRNGEFYFDYNLDVLHGWMERVPSDVYVSPDGDDANAGTSADLPLLTIDKAMLMIDADAEHPRTIHLAPGVYSPGLNDQRYPFGIKEYVTIEGAGEGLTVIDVEFTNAAVNCISVEFHVALRNMSIINVMNEHILGSILFNIRTPALSPVLMENITISDFHSWSSGIETTYATFTARNLTYRNSTAGSSQVCIRYWHESNLEPVIIENCLFENNGPYDNQDDDGAAVIVNIGRQNAPGTFRVFVSNTQITNNLNNNDFWPTSCSAISVSSNIHGWLTNCTIADNTCLENGGAVNLAGDNPQMTITNSILWGNTIFNGNQPRQIHCGSNPGYPGTLEVSSSLVQGGAGDVGNPDNCDIQWDHGNLDTDPLFAGQSADFPYALSSDSPCIDAGTLDLPDGVILPVTDLAGNPRLVGESVDLGAYEYQGVSIDEPSLLPAYTTFYVFPNPVRTQTTLKMQLAQTGEVELAIYNVRGQFVRRLFKGYSVPGRYEFTWKATDSCGKPVASGMYFARMTINGETITRKMLLLK
ncbi:MAG: T9SS type A sorting domain-containing protein [Candidatus Cloacimonetes bacterium]|nr:T9SS type A sorting domain-containing protein [Candidatus Cloacimonadota bacterium]